ncbi:uncharacterized protein Z518_07754 [Rhinocladiella mackenziei CBS 650.93]|uniref:Rhinocladiella mackenziei CBS 650.93 unplaced genomic scaffold supercont1.5, whole genome shotgun sequence n=1 Tax=Rhinocladiella mackenziei CBS 650.93 TaxID=1442369 RepID=A0A0D2J5A6_9EURO|nr:uncharacterized protein Z518_07754 [Rhinocladiella mackenziei CBS 650.93]KIX04200.1 hypothetical protein Z518_07754 [Rhinocladiella mackenziei CBS 650.93]
MPSRQYSRHQYRHHEAEQLSSTKATPRGFTSMSLLRSVKTFLTPTGSSANLEHSTGFRTAKTETELFTPTRPDVDGGECLRDCDSCTTHYPKKFSIDESDKLYGHVKGWNTHLIVGTGRTDWVRDVTDEKGSVMHAVGKAGLERRNGKLMLSASNLPSGEECHGPGEEEGTADCLLLPAWVVVEKVRPSQVEGLLRQVVEKSVTNKTPLTKREKEVNGLAHAHAQAHGSEIEKDKETEREQNLPNGETETNTASREDGQNTLPDVAGLQIGGAEQEQEQQQSNDHNATLEPTTLPASMSSSFKIRPIPHSYLILMCSHKTRDARCGQSAPLLRKEFERILRPMGLYRDLQDDRPGGVGIYFINHVGGHKYSANVMIYRRQRQEDSRGEAVQLIWLARVRPEDCENIVRYTVLQGKVVKPQTQLRGGFDRERGLTSW